MTRFLAIGLPFSVFLVSISVQADAARNLDDVSRHYRAAEARYRTCLDRNLRAKPVLQDAKELASRTLKVCVHQGRDLDRRLGEMLAFAPVEAAGSGFYIDYVVETANAITKCRSDGKPEWACSS